MVASSPRSLKSHRAAGQRPAAEQTKLSLNGCGLRADSPSGQNRSTCGECRGANSLVRVTIQNVHSSVRSLGIRREEFLVHLARNAPITVNVTAAESEIELSPPLVVCNRSQHLRLDRDPVHTYLYVHSRNSAKSLREGLAVRSPSTVMPPRTLFSCLSQLSRWQAIRRSAGYRRRNCGTFSNRSCVHLPDRHICGREDLIGGHRIMFQTRGPHYEL